ncbi:DMT family transporter [Mucilaginibacter sp. OK098]|uniref:DMT family transporter n=1 Tax=Mucilaginibacter sp. OK098 TaxID=1855297 RepID=UPI000934FEB5|nr:SMR family transporter [Mucilaginibacter sp. OK098]
MAWIYLLLAASCETAWTFCLKFMKFSDLKTLRFINFYRWQGGLPVLVPFVGYILFGVANIYLFSIAIKQIPTATAFAVWTAITLIFIKIAELLFLGQRISWIEIFFMLLIMIGIMGLKVYSLQSQ